MMFNPYFQLKSQPEARPPPGSGYGGPQTSSQHRNTTDQSHNQKVQYKHVNGHTPAVHAFKTKPCWIIKKLPFKIEL